MPELRLILALAGVAIIVLVYLLGRRRFGRKPGKVSENRVEPDFGDTTVTTEAIAQSARTVREDAVLLEGEFSDSADGAGDELSADIAASPESVAEAPRATSPVPGPAAGPVHEEADGAPGYPEAGTDHLDQERVIALRVKGPEQHGLNGTALLTELEAAGLRFGRFGIFHREEEDGQAAFSVASMLEPGTFDLETLPEEGCPGVTLFLVVPGPSQPGVALDDMLRLGHRLATDLGGELLDERGMALTRELEDRLRREIGRYDPGPVGAGTNLPAGG